MREPTRKNRMLDLFLTNTPDLVDKCKVGPGVSDHDGMVLVESRLYHKWSRKSPRKINLFRNANWEKIKADLKCEEENFFKNSPAENTVETNWSFFKQSISDAISNHVPTKTVSGRYKLPWITVHIKRLIRRKQRAFCKAKKSGTEEHWQKYRTLRKAVQTQTRKAHWDYLNGLLDPAEDRQSKNLWRYLKSQRQEASDVGTLKVEGKVADTPASKAEALNVQFSSVFTHEDHRNRPVFKNSPFPSMPEITVTTAGVKKLLERLKPRKATGPDNIPACFLQSAASELAGMLTFIFQQSLDSGDTPKDWREANVVPIFKKGDCSKPANYRPVSLTAICCKQLEHIIVSNTLQHLNDHNILTDNQHGFRRGRSCETQLIITTDDFARSLDKSAQIDVAVLDFSKAFDKVPHQRLLSKIEYYGVRGNTNRWIASFLRGRCQRVVVDGSSSGPSNVISGVPQGSVLGPLLFLLYQ